MALKGYFIQATFEDGTEVSAYAAYDGTWYYFYTDRRFRFTLTSTGAVGIQQYQPIGSNMAWYDIDIITAVNVEQFDPDNSGGGGTIPEDVYTKEEVQQLIAEAVAEVEAQIPDLVAQAVQEALDGLDDRYVRKAGDTMTGTLRVQNTAGQYSVLAATECTVFGTDNNVFMNPKTGFGVTTNTGLYKGRLDENGWYRCNLPGDGGRAVTINYDGLYTTYGGNYRLRLTSSSDSASVATYSSNGEFSRITPTGANWYAADGTASTLTAGNDAISFNKTIQVPSSASFLVSGACRYAGTYMNRYGEYWDMQFNDYSSFAWTTGQLNVNTIGFTLYYPRSGGYSTNLGAGFIDIDAGYSGTFPSITIDARNGSVNTSNSNLNLGPASSNRYSTSISGLGINFTDASHNTTLSYIMNNLGGGGGSGGGDIANVTQINIVDPNGTLIGTISGSTGSGLQIASAGAYPVSVHTGSTYQSRLSLSGGNMTLSTGGQSGQYIRIKDAITNNQSASLGTYASASIMNYEAVIVGNQVLDFCNNIIVLINNILEQQGDQFPMPSALSATKQNSFGLKMSNIQANTQLGASRMNYIG